MLYFRQVHEFPICSAIVGCIGFSSPSLKQSMCLLLYWLCNSSPQKSGLVISMPVDVRVLCTESSERILVVQMVSQALCCVRPTWRPWHKQYHSSTHKDSLEQLHTGCLMLIYIGQPCSVPWDSFLLLWEHAPGEVCTESHFRQGYIYPFAWETTLELWP